VFDKRYIFRFRALNAFMMAQAFLLYSLMGLATVVIFWAFEFGFHHLFEARELGYLSAICLPHKEP
jgi:hypothetical protein